MRFAGIDIGSRTIELVVVDEAGKIVLSLQTDTGFDPMAAAKKLINGVSFDRFPGARTVLDIGGQDSKAIALFENGKMKKFEMNDRCAAGTGKFLEIMAKTLGFEIDGRYCVYRRRSQKSVHGGPA
jgi:(R)-2-hydroxyacyl-CoA dehydratese activating ATPase